MNSKPADLIGSRVLRELLGSQVRHGAFADAALMCSRHLRKSPFHQRFKVTLKSHFLPVKMQEHSDIFSLKADDLLAWLYSKCCY